MRALIQRVSSASVRVRDGGGPARQAGAIDRGFVILVGFAHADTTAQVQWMAGKVAGLRVFEDDEGKMNLGLSDVHGAVLVVSQFTLYGDASKGRRPSFVEAARPEIAIPLYEGFVAFTRYH